MGPTSATWCSRKMLIPLVSLEVAEEVTGPVVLTTQTATVIATMFSAVMTTAVEEDTTTTSTGLRLCSAVLLTMDTWQSQAVKRNMTSSRRDSLFLMVMFTLDTG